jgi:hypothetical protein
VLGLAPGWGYLCAMTQTEQDILVALVELEDTVRRMPTANPKPSLLPFFTRLDELTRQLPPGTSSDLLHYLHKKSYEKARLFLQGRDAENQAGNCHV